MDGRFFNLNDIALIVTVVGCGFILILHRLFASHSQHRHLQHPNFWLTAFLATIVLEVLGNMMLWNPLFPTTAWLDRQLVPSLFFTSLAIRGPLLLAYVRTSTDQPINFRLPLLLHAAPALVACMFILVLSIDMSQLRDRNNATSLLTRYLLDILWYLLPAISVGYASVSLKRFREIQKSNVTHAGYFNRWLSLLILGFMFIWIWSFGVVVLGLNVDSDIANTLGTLYNYISCALIGALVYTCFYILTRNRTPVEIPKKPSFDTNTILAKIESGFKKQELHLEPKITIEQFSDEIGVPVKMVSSTINRDLQTNFFELINSYRIETAKSLLVSSNTQHLTILDILLMSGFNNKSSFHRFFKRLVGTSPTHYRKQQLEQLSPFQRNDNSIIDLDVITEKCCKTTNEQPLLKMRPV